MAVLCGRACQSGAPAPPFTNVVSPPVPSARRTIRSQLLATQPRKAICVPSGDHAGAPSSRPGAFVTCRMFEPSTLTVKSTWFAPFQRVKAIRLPSGDQIGQVSATGASVTRAAAPPDNEIV